MDGAAGALNTRSVVRVRVRVRVLVVLVLVLVLGQADSGRSKAMGREWVRVGADGNTGGRDGLVGCDGACMSDGGRLGYDAKAKLPRLAGFSAPRVQVVRVRLDLRRTITEYEVRITQYGAPAGGRSGSRTRGESSNVEGRAPRDRPPYSYSYEVSRTESLNE